MPVEQRNLFSADATNLIDYGLDLAKRGAADANVNRLSDACNVLDKLTILETRRRHDQRGGVERLGEIETGRIVRHDDEIETGLAYDGRDSAPIVERQTDTVQIVIDRSCLLTSGEVAGSAAVVSDHIIRHLSDMDTDCIGASGSRVPHDLLG